MAEPKRMPIWAAALVVVAVAGSAVAPGAGAATKCAKKKEAAGCSLKSADYFAGGSLLSIQSPHSYVVVLLKVACSDDATTGGTGSVLFGSANDGQPGSQLRLPKVMKVGRTYSATWHLTYPALMGTRTVKAKINTAKKATVTVSSQTTAGDGRTCGASKTLVLKRSR